MRLRHLDVVHDDGTESPRHVAIRLDPVADHLPLAAGHWWNLMDQLDVEDQALSTRFFTASLT